MRFCLLEFPQYCFFVPRITVRKHVQYVFWACVLIMKHTTWRPAFRSRPRYARGIFPPHYKMDEFKNATVTTHFGFVFEKNSVRSLSCSQNLHFQKVFRPHENEKPAFSNPPVLKSVFEKLRFRDGCCGR